MFIYLTDRNTEITYVNDEFTRFARENWRADFKPEDLLGRRLFSQISDVTTRHLYSLVLERIKKRKRPVTISYRCDSPTIKRFMEVTVILEPDGGAQWRNRLIREEPSPEAAILDSGRERSEQIIQACSWCKRCGVPEWLAREEGGPPAGAWVEPEEMMSLLGNQDAGRLPLLTHTACPDCYEKVMAELGDD